VCDASNRGGLKGFELLHCILLRELTAIILLVTYSAAVRNFLGSIYDWKE